MTKLDPHPTSGHLDRDGDPGGLADLDDDLYDDVDLLDRLGRAGLPVRRPTTTPATPSAGLRHLLDEAHPVASPGLRDLVANSIAATTRSAYERDWADFGIFCRANGYGDDPLDATALVVAEYINELVRDDKAYSTITRRIAAISWCQRIATGTTATHDPLIPTALAGARRILAGRALRQAAPLRLDEMRSIVNALPIVAHRRPTMRRDQLIVALGWATALRASELVGVDVDDLTFLGDPNTGDGGLVVRVRNGKGADGVEWVAVPYSTHIHTCPVRRVIAYTTSIRSGPIFRHIDRHGRTRGRLGARPVSDIVRTAITETLQHDAAGYSSHSLRAGFVTEARSHGVPDELIARHTRHARPGRRAGGILNVYDRPTDLLERPALQPAWW